MAFSSASSLVQIRIPSLVVSPSVVLEPFPLVAMPLLTLLDRARLTPMAPSLMDSSSCRSPPTLTPPVEVPQPLRPSLLQPLLPPRPLHPPQHLRLLRHLHLHLHLHHHPLVKDSPFRMARMHRFSTRSSKASLLIHPALVSYPLHSNTHEARTQLASPPLLAGENACVNGGFAQCVGGKFVSTGCSAPLVCAALPLVNSPGTSITCTTSAEALTRIQATGAKGGLTG